MKNKIFFFAAVAALCVLFASAACAREWEPGQVDATELLGARQTDVWVEGERFGDMVIGSRASLQIIYVDSDLAAAVSADFAIQDWAKKMVQYYGSDGTRGKALFIAHIETFKPMEVAPENIFVGGYHLAKGDVLSPSMTNPFGELGSGEKGYFAFVVPASELKAGKEIPVGYGDDSVLWKVPK
ncbi:hypothetical protein [Cloacibacillus sp. An23]|uniref:hypothetical protein n=1 Tax=Cloacibacillus sp. An23 TaxID=1965591 RepID=UPI001177DF62|nr:hypothetical protein [Cloacibacillus sp. An23]